MVEGVAQAIASDPYLQHGGAGCHLHGNVVHKDLDLLGRLRRRLGHHGAGAHRPAGHLMCGRAQSAQRLD